ncbi:MAG: cupin domain-containing protein [Actinomycetota bacterium]
MKANRFSDVVAYEAPNHFDCRSFRLQGFDASDSENFWVGLTHFLPGGGCEHEATPLEKVYVVTAGEITVITDDDEVTLRPNDSCHIPAGEARSVQNRTNDVASMVVVMPYPPKET